jgi:hypothetical protein
MTESPEPASTTVAALEPFVSARELNLAHANERGPWPALYQLLDAYEKQHAELAVARVQIAAMQAVVEQARNYATQGSLLHQALVALSSAEDAATPHAPASH